MKKKRLALLHSVIALLLCVAMLAGTTFAWFTDEVTSTGNIIQSGTLDVELEYWTGSEWETVQGATQLFGEDLWEPGYTEVLYLRVSNKGNLALKWQLAINIESEKSGTNKAGDSFKLSDYIHMGVVEGKQPEYATREEAVAAVEGSSGIIGKGYSKFGEMDAGAPEQYLAVVVYMPTGVDNVANHKYGTEAPTIDMGIALLATQKTAESDSFGSDYDAAAKHPLGDINYTAAESVKEKADGQGNLAESVTVGSTGDEIYAEVPAGVKLADGAEELELTVQAMNESNANVTLDNGEVAASLDVHMEGVAEDNTVPMLITLEGLMRKGLNSTSVAMYHVEDGVTVPMTLVTNPANHNEFSYDPATGDVVMCVATFSEYVAVTDNRNPWEGKANTDWYDASKDEFTLTSAEQLAGLGVLVDGGTTFEGKTVKLGNDIDLSGGNSFNPIGCGYVNGVTNSNNVTGAAFMGTFDGQGHTISGLYQNGWDLGLSYCTLGGGLFASIANGTVRNLTISGANIVMECVEQGVLVGLSQGTCTYENINIYNSKVANYQRATGGLIGEVSAYNSVGTTTIKDVTIGSDVVVGSLWGDFDAPVGGVIGARWDDSNTTAVVMNNVTVAARLDVYNDVTSTYQWYAYRRAGMLIGNTDLSEKNENGTNVATAGFLTCSNVTVKYGPWVDYHYCEFTNHNTSWPFVRVEAGENCEAFSNPRWGVPNDVNGDKVTPANHPNSTESKAKHKEGDDCMVLLPFDQLYGGGQGVYGQPTHGGVKIENYDYTITYMDRGEVFKIDYVSNGSSYTIDHKNGVPTRTETTFKAWVNAGGSQVDTIEAGNTTNYVLYDSWESIYTARFVDQFGNVVSEQEFTRSTASSIKAPSVPDAGSDFVGKWEDGWSTKLANASGDVTIYPVYTYSGKLGLTPVDSDGDGVTDYYKVQAVAELEDPVVIPGYVNGVPVKEVERLYQNSNSFWGGMLDYGANVKTIIIEEGVEDILHNGLAYTADLVEVQLPSTLKSLGKNAFSRNSGDDKKTITIKYNGTMAQFAAVEKNADWQNGLQTGTTVVCTDGTYTLTTEDGLFSDTYTWSPTFDSKLP